MRLIPNGCRQLFLQEDLRVLDELVGGNEKTVDVGDSLPREGEGRRLRGGRLEGLEGLAGGGGHF